MSDSVQAAEKTAKESAPQWVCRNCSHLNKSRYDHCEQCGFDRNFDPEKSPEIDYTVVQAQIEKHTESRRKVFKFYLEMVKDLLVVVFVLLASIVCIKFYTNWPFASTFDQDAGKLANAVLELQANITLGMTNSRYDTLLSDVIVEKTILETKYSKSPERQRTAYQKLIQAAEFYVLAKESWDGELEEQSASGDVDAGAMSTNASEQVMSRWNNAANNALVGIEDLK